METTLDTPGLLQRTRQAVDPRMRAAVGTLPPAMRRVAAYHFGWQAPDGSPAAADPGKAIRPALLLAAASALGAGSAPGLVEAAAAVELVHNFTLLHDDVMDNDTTRRHRPTAWTVFGVPAALLAGDALHALGLRLLLGEPVGAAAAARLGGCVIEICEGQHADCDFETRTDVSVAEVESMAEAKTGALLGCACALGALYAGAPPDTVAALDAFGRELGLAFQLVDDLLGIWGDPAVTGKPAGADLLVRKKSLPVVAALTSGAPAAAELSDLYSAKRPLLAEEVPRAAALIEAAGGRDWARAEAGHRLARARDLLDLTVPSATALQALADLAANRTH